MYLPHGVRVLGRWLLGWRAVFPLYAGAYLSDIVFTTDTAHAVTDQVVLYSIAVGAVSALLAFELLRALGNNLYAGQHRKMNWKWLLFAGAVASVLNSLGQSLVYSGVILPEDAGSVFLVYATGDLIGLVISMVVLMLVFRWIRLSERAE